MEQSLETLSLKQLQEKCKSLELKQYGSKATMIQRIKDHESKVKEVEIDRAMELEAALTATATNDDSNLSNLQLENDEDSGEDEGELVDLLNENSESPTKTNLSSETSYEKKDNSNKRRAVKTFYHFDSTYENRESALLKINEDFHRNRMYETKEGQKECFTCKYSCCNSKCYLLYTLDDESVSLWFNDQEHKHDDANIKEKIEWGINLSTKQAIDKLFRAGTKSAGKILSVLRIYQQETIKDKENKSINNPDFVPGIVLPSTRQIVNYVNNTLKPKVIIAKFNYAELAKWIDNHREVPESDDDVFVLDAVININDVIPKGIFYHILLFIFFIFYSSYIYYSVDFSFVNIN
jgi:hypothetical protein